MKLYNSNIIFQLNRIIVNPEQYAIRKRDIREAPLKDFPTPLFTDVIPKTGLY